VAHILSSQREHIPVTEIWLALGRIHCSDMAYRHILGHAQVLHSRNHHFVVPGCASEADRTAVDNPALEYGGHIADSAHNRRLRRTQAIFLVVFLAIEPERCHGIPDPSAHNGHHMDQDCFEGQDYFEDQGCFEDLVVLQRSRKSRSGIPLESHSYHRLVNAEQVSVLAISSLLP
jgi:hypothetical protein